MGILLDTRNLWTSLIIRLIRALRETASFLLAFRSNAEFMTVSDERGFSGFPHNLDVIADRAGTYTSIPETS